MVIDLSHTFKLLYRYGRYKIICSSVCTENSNYHMHGYNVLEALWVKLKQLPYKLCNYLGIVDHCVFLVEVCSEFECFVFLCNSAGVTKAKLP